MGLQPTLRTERLVLRPFVAADAPSLRRLISDEEVLRHLADVPRDLTDEATLEWIEMLGRAWDSRVAAVFAVELQSTAELAGGVQLQLTPDRDEAELGFWTARRHWGRGIASEAVARLIAWAPEALGLRRVHACHMQENPASGTVMRRAGMQRVADHDGGAVSYQYLVSGFSQKMRKGMAMNQHPPQRNPNTDRKMP